MNTREPSLRNEYTKLINSKKSTVKERWKRNLKRGEKIQNRKKNKHIKNEKNFKYDTFCIMDQQLNNKIASLIW